MWDENASDAELIEASRRGDRTAFGELFRRHRRVALAYARQLSGSEAQAADLVSEAFIKILNQLDRGQGPTTGFSSYLTTAVRNLYIDGYRRGKRQILVEDVADVVQDGPSGTPDPATQIVEGSTVLTAFEALSETWREVLWRVEVLGQPHAEVAQILGMTPNAVGVTVFRAREGLRESYLAQHLQAAQDEACHEAASQIPRYVRGKLRANQMSRLDEHLDTCAHCQLAVADVRELNTNLSGLLIPALVGSVGFTRGPSALESSARPFLNHTTGIVAASVAGLVGALMLFLATDGPEGQPPSLTPSSTSHSATATPSDVAALPSALPSEPPVAPRPTPPATAMPTPRPSASPSRRPSPPAPEPSIQVLDIGTLPPPPALSAPYVTVVRSSGATAVEVSVRVIEEAPSAAVSLFVEVGNVSFSGAGAGWECAATSASSLGTRIECSRKDANAAVLSAGFQVIDSGQPVAGQIGFSDQSQVMSFVTDPT